MKPELKSCAAIGALIMLGATPASAQDLGGFPIREPGGGVQNPSSPGSAPSGKRAEVIVSQAAGSKVTSVAQAMRLVKPGGTILVQGGTYTENLSLYKPVSIRGVPDAYGRNAVFKPSPQKSCVTVTPDAPFAAVSISHVVFKFDANAYNAPCIDVAGGSFTLRDSFVIPADADIPVRAAYGQLLPEVYDVITDPARDYSASGGGRDAPISEYAARHARPAGANNPMWRYMAGGTDVEGVIHARTVSATGVLSGPAAGIRVSAGQVDLVGNVIIGARVGVDFVSSDGARINGQMTNNVLLGNGMGVGVKATATDLVLASNTIRYNYGAGVKADVYNGIKIVSNEISGNQTGIDLAAKVRMADITSNLIVNNNADALKVSNGFFGAVSANTIAGNGGCTVQFYSAEQKILRNIDMKVMVSPESRMNINYENNNYAIDNAGDVKKRERRGIFGRKKKREQENQGTSKLVACGDDL